MVRGRLFLATTQKVMRAAGRCASYARRCRRRRRPFAASNHPGIGPHHSAACDCDRFYGCHGGDCAAAGGGAARLFLAAAAANGALHVVLLLLSLHLWGRIARRWARGTIPSGTASPCVTLLFNMVAGVAFFTYATEVGSEPVVLRHP